MTSEEYMTARVQEQFEWYEAKSVQSKNRYHYLRIAEIVAAALIPFLSGLTLSVDNFKYTGTIIVGTLGMIVTILAGVLSLRRFQENWIEYRKTAESLKREKYLFETQVEPYNGDNRFNLFVQTVESLLAKENTNWAQNMLKAQSEKPDNKK
ncbi:MAG: DUF4231 domain-containing protein [Pyrinomonadaceae bacterium]